MTKQAAFLEADLRIRKSTLPNAGKGLFTTKAIPKGTRIVEYSGKRTTWKEAEQNPNNGYIFFISNKNVIDALDNKEEFARYANDARGLTRVAGIKNNAEYVIEKGKAYIDAIANIPAGGEIFVSYGKDYWDVIRQNIKIEEREQKAKAKKK